MYVACTDCAYFLGSASRSREDTERSGGAPLHRRRVRASFGAGGAASWVAREGREKILKKQTTFLPLFLQPCSLLPKRGSRAREMTVSERTGGSSLPGTMGSPSQRYNFRHKRKEGSSDGGAPPPNPPLFCLPHPKKTPQCPTSFTWFPCEKVAMGGTCLATSTRFGREPCGMAWDAARVARDNHAPDPPCL